ncbi:MAG: hypothetical protein ACRYFX_18750 [Janthinobacterium lividum]
MAVAPEKPFDPAAIAREKQAKQNSPPYRRVHPTVSVYDFLQLKGNYPAQRQIDNECREIEAGTRKWDAAAAEWLLLYGTEWHPPDWTPPVHRPRLRPRYQPHGPHQLRFAFYQ